MATIDELFDAARSGLARPFRLPADAAPVAMNLFMLTQVHQLTDDPRVVELQERYREALGGRPPEEILANQLDYASRLAAAPGPLLYEEMHKLFSLADQVHALRGLGYTAADAVVRRFESDLRTRFAEQPKVARLVAEDRAENWNRGLWWYAENLPM
jgi:hypothetical protein